MAIFERRRHRLSVQGSDVVEVKVTFIVDDLQAGTVTLTDIMLQAGQLGIQWQPHPSELRWQPDI